MNIVGIIKTTAGRYLERGKKLTKDREYSTYEIYNRDQAIDKYGLDFIQRLDALR